MWLSFFFSILKDKSFKNCLEYTHRVKGKTGQRTEENHENDSWIKWECQQRENIRGKQKILELKNTKTELKIH